MKALKTFTNFFFESQEEKKEEVKPEAKVDVTVPPVSNYGFNPQPIITSVNEPDPNIVKFLASEIDKKNLPGFDYLEYKNLVASLAQIANESDKFTTAFNSANALGMGKITKQL